MTFHVKSTSRRWFLKCRLVEVHTAYKHKRNVPRSLAAIKLLLILSSGVFQITLYCSISNLLLSWKVIYLEPTEEYNPNKLLRNLLRLAAPSIVFESVGTLVISFSHRPLVVVVSTLLKVSGVVSFPCWSKRREEVATLSCWYCGNCSFSELSEPSGSFWHLLTVILKSRDSQIRWESSVILNLLAWPSGSHLPFT